MSLTPPERTDVTQQQTEDQLARQHLEGVSAQAKLFLLQGIQKVHQHLGPERTLALIQSMNVPTRDLLLAVLTESQPAPLAQSQVLPTATGVENHVASPEPIPLPQARDLPTAPVVISPPKEDSQKISAFKTAISEILTTGPEQMKREAHEKIVLAAFRDGLSEQEITGSFKAGSQNQYIAHAIRELRRKGSI